MAEPWLELDAVLRERLRDVLQEPPRPLTESELRSLLEDGRACMLILSGELDRLERRLAQLDGDPDTSFSALTDAFRRVNELRTHVEELRALLADLEKRAREVRASWQRQIVDRA
jgi:chromosome segregation ATPase